MKKMILVLVLMPVLSFAMRTIDPNTQRLLDILWRSSSEPQEDSDQNAQEVARLLIGGADAQALGSQSIAPFLISPLHKAAESGSTKLVKLLLPYYKDNINLRDKWGKTPLFTAIMHGVNVIEVVTLLLNSGADPKIPDRNGLLPIDYVLRINQGQEGDFPGREIYPQVEKLLKDYSDISPESILKPTPETVEKAIKVGAESLVKQLLLRLNPTRENLEKAIKVGSITSVKQLLPQLDITPQQISSFGQDARARFKETKDPAYQEIGRLLQERFNKIVALIGTTSEGRRSPAEIATTIVNMSKPPIDEKSKATN